VEGYTYDTFGKFQRFGNAVMNTYGFTGREYDAETGLYYYRARYYDPETGRFISKDPIGFAGGDANLYNYVLGDPVNWGDPWGLKYGDWWDPRTYIYDAVGYWGEFSGGLGDFANNYIDMRQANTIGADKYFHCKANCESAQRGPGGEDAACVVSDTRELLDQHIKGYPALDSAADQVANQYGRNQGAVNRGIICEQICAPFRPNGLTTQY